MKINHATWFTLRTGQCIGIVVGEDEVTKKKKAYIGTGKGIDEEADKKKIVEQGTSVSILAVEEICKQLKED